MKVHFAVAINDFSAFQAGDEVPILEPSNDTVVGAEKVRITAEIDEVKTFVSEDEVRMVRRVKERF